MPPRNASGALGRITVSKQVQSWLQFVTDRHLDDPDYSEALGAPSMPSTFKLGANWIHAEHVFAADLVRQAFECGVLEHPDELESVEIESPSSSGTYGRSSFTVAIEWRGRNRNLRLKSHRVMLADLDPGNTTRGAGSALRLLRVVAGLASELLDDLAAEGVRTTAYWDDRQAETDAAADEVSLRQPRNRRLRRWLLRNIALRGVSASTDFAARNLGLIPQSSLASTQWRFPDRAPGVNGKPTGGGNSMITVTIWHNIADDPSRRA